MIPAPIPANEADRVASLHRMNLVSTPREADLDRITRVAQKLFGTEISSYVAKQGGRDRHEIAGDVDPAFHGVALA